MWDLRERRWGGGRRSVQEGERWPGATKQGTARCEAIVQSNKRKPGAMKSFEVFTEFKQLGIDKVLLLPLNRQCGVERPSGHFGSSSHHCVILSTSHSLSPYTPMLELSAAAA
jgi:hypothetical protein